MSTPIPEEGERFLRRLRSGLSSLPASERDEILEDVRAHIGQRYAEGRGDVLEAFGEPEAYAGQFLEERFLASAVAEDSAWALGRALAKGMRSVGETVFVVGPLLLLQGASILLLVLAALKLIFFRSFGYFTNAHGSHWVGVSDSAADVDIFGWWTIPLFVVPSVLVLWGSRRALAALARRRLARARAGLSPLR